jgi:Zn finger protein HypA/HybF involved in hydrogenase expression
MLNCQLGRKSSVLRKNLSFMVNHLCYGTLSDEQPFSKLTGPCTESCHDYYADRLKDHMTAQHQMTDVCPIHEKKNLM